MPYNICVSSLDICVRVYMSVELGLKICLTACADLGLEAQRGIWVYMCDLHSGVFALNIYG